MDSKLVIYIPMANVGFSLVLLVNARLTKM
ncbi:hypothetical protein CLV42_101875 [Chitinophaga ginsengisoli]|uniref:Uncharacterized protein n=1 Tax=Chitinophaga ginsengisoli TaxID=363837 RepID=A0A2P8GQ60_9BACT|nr:hypothetical protein CLV42_101875 [Chitinophaga ginsengisoli]